MYSSQVLGITQTSDKYMWLGTESGLVRFDGHTFKTFKHDPLDSTSIPGNYISQILSDKYNRIWMDVNNQLSIYIPTENRFYKPVFPDHQNQRHYHRFKYFPDKDIVWIITSKGLYFCKGNSFQLEYFPLKIPHLDLMSLEISGDQIMWLVSTYGVYEYFPNSHKYILHNRVGNKPDINNDDGFFCSFLEDSILWMGGWTHGMTGFNIRTGSQQNFSWSDHQKFQNGVLKISASPFQDEKHLLWLATTSGIYTFNKTTQEFHSHYSETIDDIFKIPGAGFSFFAVPDQMLWIGTYKGLHKYDVKKQLIKTIPLNLATDYNKYSIRNFCFQKGQIKDSILFILYDYADIVKYDLVNNKRLPLPSDLTKYMEFGSDPIAIFIDHLNRLWISSGKYGVIFYNLLNGQLNKPNYFNEETKRTLFLSVTAQKANQIWLTSTKGLFYYDEKNNSINPAAEFNASLIHHKLSTYISTPSFTDHNEIITISNKGGSEADAIVRYNLNNHNLEIYDADNYTAISQMKQIEAIELLKQNRIFISSIYGFAIAELKSHCIDINNLTECNGRAVLGFKNIAIESDSAVWLSHDFGVSRFDLVHKVMTPFSYYNSKIGKEPSAVIVKSPNENLLYVGQNKALNTINFENINNKYEYEIIISDIKIKDRVLSKMPKHNDKLLLKHYQNMIEIDFTILNFTNSNDILYQYKFVPSFETENQQNWLSMSENKLIFQSIGPGTSHLLVRAFDSFGKPSSNIYKLYFIIKPPFWKSGWFTILIMSLISVLIYSLFKYRENQRLKLEQLRYNIARDLHDDMGSNLSQIKILSELEALKSGNQTHASISRKLGDIMQNMSEIVWSINPRYDHFNDVIIKIQEFAIQTLESKEISLKFEVDEIPKNIKLNPEQKRHFYLIFKEAINNIAKYSNAKNVKFRISFKDQTIHAQIVDDGIGFDPEIIKHGNGLRNMKTRAEALNARLNITTGDHGTSISLNL
ncbi:MAG: hypothetical protein IPM92_08920 [Saprospiraceae bacterium]|nr:hypothetical protein [Saprospiraceae bacterium]